MLKIFSNELKIFNLTFCLSFIFESMVSEADICKWGIQGVEKFLITFQGMIGILLALLMESVKEIQKS